MNECEFASIRSDFVDYFKRKMLIPIVGSGISVKCKTTLGEVPTGSEMIAHMVKTLSQKEKFTTQEKNDFNNQKFPELCQLFEDDHIVPQKERRDYYSKNFQNAHIEDSRTIFFDIDWPYIYSINIDDAIENSTQYNTMILPNRTVNESVFSEKKCLIKLHGDIDDIIKYSDSIKVFTTKEYAISHQTNEYLLAKLKNDYSNLNIVYFGCSLDSEFDIIALDYYSKNVFSTNKLNRIFYFTLGNTNETIKSKLRAYGITDIISFDSYDSMYTSINEAWLESQLIPLDDIDTYSDIAVKEILQDPELDKQYLIWGKNLINRNEITIPSFFINRTLAKDYNKFLSKRLNFIVGGRFSGKSYFLVSMFNSFPGIKRYIFDGSAKLNSAAFNSILSISKSILFFDVGSLTAEQIDVILKCVVKTDNTFFIAINKNDFAVLSSIENSISNKSISNSDFLIHDISNRFNTTELETINKKLPFAKIPVFKNISILDNIIDTETKLSINGRFSRTFLLIKNYKELAYLIILATKNTISTLNMCEFDITEEYAKSSARYAPLIESQHTFMFEKSSFDISAKKVVLNAPLWLYKELGAFSANKENTSMVVNSYKYIINKIIHATQNNLQRRRVLLKEFTLFETVNSIFAKKGTGQLSLLVSIYDGLREFLADDFNFLHQSAKCDLWYTSLHDENRLAILNDADNKLIVAQSLAEKDFEKSVNYKLQISLAHIQFTHATILSEIVILENYESQDSLYKALDAIAIAFSSPYNKDQAVQLINRRNPARMIEMLNEIFSNSNIKSMLSKDYVEQCSYLLQKIREFLSEHRL